MRIFIHNMTYFHVRLLENNDKRDDHSHTSSSFIIILSDASVEYRRQCRMIFLINAAILMETA